MSKQHKIAVIGSGGREHAIAWKLSKDIGAENVFVLPGSTAIPNSRSVDIHDFLNLKNYCLLMGIDRIFVGPEQPLANGIVDYFKDSDILVLGPDAAAARLESSKIFAKKFMERHAVSTASFAEFDDIKAAREWVVSLERSFVIKLDGLAGGKGVFVCDDAEEGLNALDFLAEKYGDHVPLIIEDKILGDEISIIGFTDGEVIRLLQPSQDHKQLLDGDKGPNTGGMGAYCPVPDWNAHLEETIRDSIIEPTLRGIREEGMNYRGIIYFGIMVTAHASYLLEYNVRLGDPETEVLLPSLKSSLAELMEATLTGSLKRVKPAFYRGYFADVVLVSKGYPGSYETGKPIRYTEPPDEDVLIFNAGVAKENGNPVTAGGRVINVVARGKTLDDALKKVYSNVEKIDFEGKFFRKDIGKRENNFFERKWNKKKRIAIFISGRGSNMEAIVKSCQDGILSRSTEVVLVFSNRLEAEGLAKAVILGVPTAAIASKGKKRVDFDKEVLSLLKGKAIDYIVLAGFMRRLSPVFIRAYDGRIINIHPADTNHHRGLHAYEWAWKNKLKETIITVHYVNENIDDGQIIRQEAVDLRGAKSLEEVKERGLKVEHEFYPKVLQLLFDDELKRFFERLK